MRYRPAGRLHLETPLGEHEVDVAFDQPIGFLVADLVAAAGLPGDPLEWVLVPLEEVQEEGTPLDPSGPLGQPLAPPPSGQSPGKSRPTAPKAREPLPRPTTLRSAGIAPGARLRLERRARVDDGAPRHAPLGEPLSADRAPAAQVSPTTSGSPATRRRRAPFESSLRQSAAGFAGAESPAEAGSTRRAEGCLVAVVGITPRAGATTITALLSSRLEWRGGRSLAVELPQTRPGEPRLSGCLACGRPVPVLDETIRRASGRSAGGAGDAAPRPWLGSDGRPPAERSAAVRSAPPAAPSGRPRARVVCAPPGRARAEAIDERELVAYLRAELATGTSVFLDAGHETQGGASAAALVAADQILLVDSGSAAPLGRSASAGDSDLPLSALWASGWPPLVVANRRRGARRRLREIQASLGEVEPGPSLVDAPDAAERLARGDFTWAEPGAAWADPLDQLLALLGLP